MERISYYFVLMFLLALKNSHPIEVDVANSAQINEIFDAISYNKGMFYLVFYFPIFCFLSLLCCSFIALCGFFAVSCCSLLFTFFLHVYETSCSRSTLDREFLSLLVFFCFVLLFLCFLYTFTNCKRIVRYSHAREAPWAGELQEGSPCVLEEI